MARLQMVFYVCVRARAFGCANHVHVGVPGRQIYQQILTEFDTDTAFADGLHTIAMARVSGAILLSGAGFFRRKLNAVSCQPVQEIGAGFVGRGNGAGFVQAQFLSGGSLCGLPQMS